MKQVYEETCVDIHLPCKYLLLLHLQDNSHLVEKFAIDLKYNAANRFQQYPENKKQLIDKLIYCFLKHVLYFSLPHLSQL